jgi:flagellar protein FliL
VSAKPATAAHDEAPAKKGPGLMAWALVSLVSGGAGFFVPMLLASKGHTEAQAEEKKTATVAKAAEKLVVVPFDTEGVVVNLNEVQQHYLRFKMALEVDASQEKVVVDLIREHKVALLNWLILHVGDKDMDDVRGAAGKNMLRREILERFNSMLFKDGYDRIYDVLFQEFTIQ